LEKSDAPPITLLWIGKDPLEDLEQYYFDEANCEASIRFRGICPDKISLSDKEQEQTDMSEYLSDLLDDPKKVFGSFLNEINYLGPFREEPSRIYRFSGGLFRDVGIRGEKAPGLLNDDKIRRKGEVLSAVGSWFSEHLGGWPLDLSSQGDYFSLILRNPKNPSVEVNITDVGNGIAQVLPVVVQRQFANMAGEKRGLEIVEHPELHLHPGAHGAIADLYATAVKTSGMRCLIETHSENFVLRIRRRIADRTLHPDDVIIYWIKDEADSDTRIQRINIDADGEADHWPAGVFSEDFDEVRAIRDAQKRHHR
jgi:hypothetical protein